MDWQYFLLLTVLLSSRGIVWTDNISFYLQSCCHQEELYGLTIFPFTYSPTIIKRNCMDWHYFLLLTVLLSSRGIVWTDNISFYLQSRCHQEELYGLTIFPFTYSPAIIKRNSMDWHYFLLLTVLLSSRGIVWTDNISFYLQSRCHQEELYGLTIFPFTYSPAIIKRNSIDWQYFLLLTVLLSSWGIVWTDTISFYLQSCYHQGIVWTDNISFYLQSRYHQGTVLTDNISFYLQSCYHQGTVLTDNISFYLQSCYHQEEQYGLTIFPFTYSPAIIKEQYWLTIFPFTYSPAIIKEQYWLTIFPFTYSPTVINRNSMDWQYFLLLTVPLSSIGTVWTDTISFYLQSHCHQ